MLTYKTAIKRKQTIIKCKLDNNTVLDNEISIVNSGCLVGLASIEPVSNVKLKYVIPTTTLLGDALKYGITGNQLDSMLRQVLNVIEQTEKEDLNSAKLLLDLNYTYFDLQTGRIYFIYQPLAQPSANYSLTAFISGMLYLANMIDEEGKTMVSGLNRFMYEHPDSSIDVIRNAIDKVEGNEKVAISQGAENNVAQEMAFEPDDDVTFEPGYDDEYFVEETVILEDSDGDDVTVILEEEPSERAFLIREDGERIEINGDYATLGRTGGNADCIVTDDKTVGRKHAIIFCKDGKYYILDNESTNGTFLNNDRLVSEEPVEIASGDSITLAKTILQFIIEKE